MIKIENWTGIEKQSFNETAARQVFSGENVMLVLNTIKPGFPSFRHSHPHEQILYILEGRCKVTIGDESTEMRAGDMVCIVPNVEHDLEVIGDDVVINMDVFSPIREDYLNK